MLALVRMRCAICGRALDDYALYCGLCGRRSRRRRDSQLGAVLGDTYRVNAKVGEGGFGVIYRATHLPTGLELALKVLHADLAGDGQIAARFRRESRVLANLRDPHTVVTYERGEFRDGTPYIAMELLRGQTLLQRFRERGALSWREVLGVMRAACSSIGEAHTCGIVHRDLKPANIHIGDDGFVKVLDFGVARFPSEPAADGSFEERREITFVGQLVGTLDYMAPEQLAGVPCTSRADIYSLGVVAFEMICGRRPFPDATTATSLMTTLLTQRPPIPSSLVPVPEVVDRILLQCLERDPEHRFSTMEQISDAIEMALEAQRSSRPPRVAQLHPVELGELVSLPAWVPVAEPARPERVITYVLGAAIAAVGAAIAWVALS